MAEATRAAVEGAWRLAPGWLDAAANQVAWWSCVLLVRAGFPLVAVLGPAAYVLAHVGPLRGKPKSPSDVAGEVGALAVAGVLVGFVVDTSLSLQGGLSFPQSPTQTVPAPFMVALWAAAAVSVRASCRGLLGLPLAVVAMVGAVAGPLAYLGGQRLGVLSLSPGTVPLVGLHWGCAVPLVVLMARRVLRRGAEVRQ